MKSKDLLQSVNAIQFSVDLIDNLCLWGKSRRPSWQVRTVDMLFLSPCMCGKNASAIERGNVIKLLCSFCESLYRLRREILLASSLPPGWGVSRS